MAVRQITETLGICIYVYMYTCIYVYMYTYYVYMYICIDVYLFICIYVYTYIYISYIYISYIYISYIYIYVPHPKKNTKKNNSARFNRFLIKTMALTPNTGSMTKSQLVIRSPCDVPWSVTWYIYIYGFWSSPQWQSWNNG